MKLSAEELERIKELHKGKDLQEILKEGKNKKDDEDGFTDAQSDEISTQKILRNINFQLFRGSLIKTGLLRPRGKKGKKHHMRQVDLGKAAEQDHNVKPVGFVAKISKLREDRRHIQNDGHVL